MSCQSTVSKRKITNFMDEFSILLMLAKEIVMKELIHLHLSHIRCMVLTIPELTMDFLLERIELLPLEDQYLGS
jgi:hypothetical protein